MKIIKNKLISFITYLINSNYYDNITKNNLRLTISVLNTIDYNCKGINKIVDSSKNIIDKLNNAYNSFSDSLLTFIKKDNLTYDEIRLQLDNYPTFYQNIDLVNKISNCKRYQYKLKIDDININLFFYCEDNDNNDLARIIYTFIKTFSRNNSMYNDFNIRFLLIDFPRVITNINESHKTGEFDNSSGMTNLRKKEMIMTRKSGLKGLLIHELCHMLGLEFCYNYRDDDYSEINWVNKWEGKCCFKRNHGVRNFYEGICNTNSSYYLSIYNAIVLYSKDNKNSIYKYFKYFFCIEQLHSYIQSVKLARAFNINSYQDFFNNKNDIYKQNALMFEYIILRLFMIYDYNIILNEMIRHDFNNTSTSSNIQVQTKINNEILNKIKSKRIQDMFNNIIRLGNNLGNSVEYFSINSL